MTVALTFITRADCHLCEQARDDVDAVLAERSRSGAQDVSLRVVDIDSDEQLLAKYDWDVPVVLVEGRQHSFHRVDRQRLAAAIDRAASR